jgi:hypothetical protein
MDREGGREPEVGREVGGRCGYQFHGSLKKGRKQLAAKLMTRSSAKAAVKKI